jgi:hypothetical protein
MRRDAGCLPTAPYLPDPPPSLHAFKHEAKRVSIQDETLHSLVKVMSKATVEL